MWLGNQWTPPKAYFKLPVDLSVIIKWTNYYSNTDNHIFTTENHDYQFIYLYTIPSATIQKTCTVTIKQSDFNFPLYDKVFLTKEVNILFSTIFRLAIKECWKSLVNLCVNMHAVCTCTCIRSWWYGHELGIIYIVFMWWGVKLWSGGSKHEPTAQHRQYNTHRRSRHECEEQAETADQYLETHVEVGLEVRVVTHLANSKGKCQHRKQNAFINIIHL